jgi:hypothetical protein
MRRHQIIALAALAATALSLPAAANGSVATGHPRQGSPAPEARNTPFTPGAVPCSLIPVPAATAPVGTGGCPGVRPGSRLLTTFGLCTANFLFRAPDGTRYIGTAGHCIGTGKGSTGKGPAKVWPPGSGPEAQDADGHRIGEFAYGALQYPDSSGAATTYTKNFALIRLDPGVDASPEMCYFGGPRGLYATDTAGPFVLHYYGNGDTISTVLPARSGVAQGTPDPDHIYATGLALPGDGGSGVMTADGLALGILVTSGPHGVGFAAGTEDPPAAYLENHQGTMGITRLAPQLALASQTLGVPLELVTAD